MRKKREPKKTYDAKQKITAPSIVNPIRHSRSLGECHVVLVASPDLLVHHPVCEYSDIRNHTLIYTRDSDSDWAKVWQWLRIEPPEEPQKLVMDCYLSAMKAAEQGLGIAIGIMPLINNWLREHRLVALTPKTRTPQRHYFVCQRNSAKSSSLDCVYEWVNNRFMAISEI